MRAIIFCQRLKAASSRSWDQGRDWLWMVLLIARWRPTKARCWRSSSLWRGAARRKTGSEMVMGMRSALPARSPIGSDRFISGLTATIHHPNRFNYSPRSWSIDRFSWACDWLICVVCTYRNEDRSLSSTRAMEHSTRFAETTRWRSRPRARRRRVEGRRKRTQLGGRDSGRQGGAGRRSYTRGSSKLLNCSVALAVCVINLSVLHRS